MKAALSLKAQIAGLTIVVAVVSALGATLGPHQLFRFRNTLFLESLAPGDRARLEALQKAVGPCSPQIAALRRELGFERWALDYSMIVVLLVALVALGTAALAWFLAKRVSAPIEALAQSALSVASGGRTAPAPLRSGSVSEVRGLHEAFSSMTRALSAADSDLRLRSAAIAHDIRTPLTILRGRLIGAEVGVFPADENFLRGLLQPVDILDQVVSDVNALADAGAAAGGVRERVDLASLAKEAVEALGPELERAEVRVSFAADGETFVEADPVRLRRALFNILKNVLRYAPGAPAALTVRARGDWVILRCADQGPGWPPGDSMAMAEAFVRGESSRSRETGGVGLGLSIVRALTEAYGGTLQLARGPDRGAVVEVRLPRSRA